MCGVSVGVEEELVVPRRSSSREGGVFRCDRKCEEECRKIGPLLYLSPPLGRSEREREAVRLGGAGQRGMAGWLKPDSRLRV